MGPLGRPGVISPEGLFSTCMFIVPLAQPQSQPLPLLQMKT